MKKSNACGCTIYGQSVLLVYEQFSENEPISMESLCLKLGKKIYKLVLEGDSIGLFIRRLVDAGYFEASSNGYTITTKGLKEREALRKLCHSC